MVYSKQLIQFKQDLVSLGFQLSLQRFQFTQASIQTGFSLQRF